MLIGTRAILTVFLTTVIVARSCEPAFAWPQAGSARSRQEDPPSHTNDDIDSQQQDSSPRGESVTRWSREGC
jgi:hypothetical protein